MFSRQEVYDAFAELSYLHIEHFDIKFANIYKVAPGGLPSLASPYTGKTYSCRIIDFEIVRKIGKRRVAIIDTMELTIGSVLRHLPYKSFFCQNVD